MYKISSKFWLILSFTLAVNSALYAQNERIQQLLKDLQTATTDSSKVYLNKQLGYYYQNVNQRKALDYFDEAMAAAIRTNDSLQIANIHYSMGFTHSAALELPQALENYLQATRIYEDLNDTWRLVNTHMSIVNLYINNKDVEKQSYYLDRAEAILLKENDSSQLSTFYTQKGVIYDQQSKLDSAVVFLRKSLLIAEKIKDSSAIGSAQINLGLTFKHQGNNQEALEQFNKALELFMVQKEPFTLGIVYNNIGSTYAQLKNYSQAQKNFNLSIKYAKEAGSQPILLENYKNLASMYGSSASYKNQADYLNKYYTLKDSLYTIEKENQLTQLESDYVIEKKNLELETKDLELQKKQAQSTTYIVLFIFSLLILALLILYYKKSRKKNQLLTTKNTLINEQKTTLEHTLNHLKATQSQLIQSEKMASLGELTAGIAHEIQNPLNFVNNFSEVSNELIDEMTEELDKGEIEEAKDISRDIKQNLEKIIHHGKRADGIVKGMLQHSRASNGKKEPTDLNALADEYLRLAYHGLRAKDKSFNAQLVTDFDEGIGKVNIVPQDAGRVVLNLLTNAFYAVHEKAKENVKNFEPTVSISTKKSKDKVILEVRDNGNGIPDSVKEKIFQPFFTTKPTGQGTGLGLSLSYDIVKGHGGELIVETKEYDGTKFSILLPL
jgi:signal transduction histidine kinase